MPVGSALLARTDALDAHGCRVYRVTPTGTVIYDEWIDHDPADGGLALTRLRAAARRSPEAALRDALAGRADHAAARDVAEWLANEPVETLRPDEASLTGRTAPVAPEPRASASARAVRAPPGRRPSAAGWCGPTHGCARRSGSRELDEAAVRTALADQGDGPFDIRVIECAVAGGYGGGRRRDGVDRRDAPPGRPEGRAPRGIPSAPGHHVRSRHAPRRLVCRWL